MVTNGDKGNEQENSDNQLVSTCYDEIVRVRLNIREMVLPYCGTIEQLGSMRLAAMMLLGELGDGNSTNLHNDCIIGNSDDSSRQELMQWTQQQ